MEYKSVKILAFFIMAYNNSDSSEIAVKSKYCFHYRIQCYKKSHNK